MKYFQNIELPIFDSTKLISTLNHLLVTNLVKWNSNQICLTSIKGKEFDYTLGTGSLVYDWHNRRDVETDSSIEIIIPKKSNVLEETQFTELCTQFKGGIFEKVYNSIKGYNIGRLRIMRLDPKICLSWHKDDNKRLHYPMQTQEGCFMIIEDEAFHIPQNSWWITDTTKNHTALNSSKRTRLHLVGNILDVI